MAGQSVLGMYVKNVLQGKFRADSAGDIAFEGAGTGHVDFNYAGGNGGVNFYDGASGLLAQIDSSGNVTTNGKLAVSGTGNTTIAGNVGIGTPTPRGKLDVNGSVVFEGLGTSYATTTSLGGGALLAGACASVTITTGVGRLSSTPAFVTTPQSDVGDGYWWNTIAMSATSFKTRVCASVAGTPTASIYNVKIIN